MVRSKTHLTLPSANLIQALLWVSACVLIYGLFRDGSLDNRVTAWFYDTANPLHPWSQQSSWWVAISYRGISILTVLLGLSIIACYALSFYYERLRHYRSLCVLMFFLLALSPGLVVNSILKDNWGRPRPRDTVQFGGNANYQAPFVISDQGGKSFPCGHCSVAFALGGIGLWLRRRWKRWFWFFLIASLLLGLVVGLARVAVGAHYLSDVLVSGLVVYATALLLVTCFPKYCLGEESSPAFLHSPLRPWQKRVVISASAVLTLLLLFSALLAFPFSKQQVIPLEVPPTSKPDDWVVVLLETEDDLVADTSPIGLEPGTKYVLRVDMNGFGFPWNRAEVKCDAKPGNEAVDQIYHLSLVKSGVFTELKSKVLLERK